MSVCVDVLQAASIRGLSVEPVWVQRYRGESREGDSGEQWLGLWVWSSSGCGQYVLSLPGAVCVETDNPLMTHLLVANGVDPLSIPSCVPSRVHIVRQQVGGAGHAH